MRSLILVAAAVCQPACLDLRDGASLSQLSTAGVSLSTSTRDGGGQALFAGFGLPGTGEDACAKIADDIHASVDGSPMPVASRGEWHASPGIGQGPWCSVAGFRLESIASQPSGTTSTIVIADSATTWTIEVRDLLANALEIDPLVRRSDGFELDARWASSAGTIHYVSGSTPSSLSWSWWNEPNNGASSVTVSGDEIALAVPTTIDEIYLEVERVGDADTCEGPAACGLDLNASATRTF